MPSRRCKASPRGGFHAVPASISKSFSWFVILPLFAAAFYSTAMIITRSKCQNDAPLALLGFFLVAGMIGIAALATIGLGADAKSTFPFLLGDWAPMGLREWSLMALLGVLAATYFMGVARAYQIAPPQIIARSIMAISFPLPSGAISFSLRHLIWQRSAARP